MAEGGSLENCYTRNGIVSSNLTPTADDIFYREIASAEAIEISKLLFSAIRTRELEFLLHAKLVYKHDRANS